MKKFEKVNFELNEKGEMKQNVRNSFKSAVIDEVLDILQNAGLEALRVDGGIAINIANDELGAIAVVFDGVVKSLSYDAEYEAIEYVKKIAERNEKQKEKEKAKAEKFAKAQLEKEAKANKSKAT